MKNTIITASIVSNIFLAILLYGFTQGKIERHAPDYLEEISAPVHLSKR